MTTIERAHEQLLNHRGAVPHDDSRITQWLEGHDAIEEKIGCLSAETLDDVLIKLDILCDRLQQASICAGDLIIARSIKKDFMQLILKYDN